MKPLLQNLLTGVCGLLLSVAIAPETVQATDRHPGSVLPHGPRTREAFIAAKTLDVKSLAAGEKSGETGAAAVTSDRYDMLRQRLDLRVDPATESISGEVQMVFSSRQAGLGTMVFDLAAALDLVAIEHLSGNLAFARGADTVVVTLPTALADGQVDSFVVHYGGDQTSPVANRGLMFKSHFPLPPIPQTERVPLVANVSQPAYAQNWWPCKDRPDDKILMSMNLTVPDTLLGVSNGTLTGSAPADPGWRTWSWRENYPIATYLVSVAISDYVQLSEPCLTTGGSNVPLENFVLPRDVDNALVDFAPLCDMVEFCEGLYGPYPFAGEKYGHAVFIWPGAMEHQTVTSIGTTFIDGTGDSAWLVMHELAHQWFGDSMTPQFWADIWLNEGFATYAEALWFEETEGAGAYATYLANARHESEWRDQGPVYDPVPIFPGRVIYDKGAWILHMLRDRMGDTAFFALVADWTSGGGRPLGHVTTDAFILLASAHAGEDLADFLWPYLETTALPVLDFRPEVVAGLAGADTRLEVTLSQLQTPLFDNTYTIRVTTTAGTTELRLNLATPQTAAVFELDDPIIDVDLDPDKLLLWRGAGPTADRQGLTFAFPNPTRGGYIVLRYRLTQAARPDLRIYDAMGREVSRRDLGSQESGTHDYGFDVNGNAGDRLASGVYWAALYVDGQRTVSKFTVVR